MGTVLTIIIVILTLSVSTMAGYMLFFYKEQRNTKIICSISIILSIIAILCSIRIYPFEISDIAAFIGVIAGVIAIPTAVVVGWNIYTVIDIKNIKNTFDEENNKRDGKIKEINTKLDKDIQSVKDDIIYDVDMEFTILYNLLSAKDRGGTDFLVCCINSFYMTKRIRNSFIFLRNMCMDYSLVMIKSTISIENEKSELSKDEHFINRVSANAIKYLLEEFDSFSENEKEQKYKGVGNTLHEILRMKTKNKS